MLSPIYFAGCLNDWNTLRVWGCQISFINCDFRDKDSFEVDIVLERGAYELTGVEVKASATVTAADFRGLRKLKAAAKNRFAGGVVLYDAEASVSFGNNMHAVPILLLWKTP